MQDFFSTLLTIAGDIASEPEGREALVFAAWRRAAGEMISDKVVPIRFSKDVLWIAVADKTWQRQLADHSRELLFKISSLLDQITVNRLEFCIDTKALESKIRKTKAPFSRQPEETLPTLAPELARSANAIRDRQLREQFIRAAAAAQQATAQGNPYGR